MQLTASKVHHQVIHPRAGPWQYSQEKTNTKGERDTCPIFYGIAHHVTGRKTVINMQISNKVECQGSFSSPQLYSHVSLRPLHQNVLSVCASCAFVSVVVENKSRQFIMSHRCQTTGCPTNNPSILPTIGHLFASLALWDARNVG